MIFLQLFATFFQIGLFTFGGGYAMIPMITSKVLTANWITTEQLIDFIAISESTPGPFAINIATFVGMKTAGLIGAIGATAGVIFPSLIIIILVVKIFTHFSQNSHIKNALSGIRPAVIGLIGAAVWSIGSKVFFQNTGYGFYWQTTSFSFNLTALSLSLILLAVFFHFQKLHPVLLILLAAGLGVVAYGILPGFVQ